MQKRRLKILRAIRTRAGRHRYNFLRFLGLSVSIGILVAVPLSGLARLDLWRGNHMLGFHPAAFNVTLSVVIGVFAVVYAATFLINLVAGRMLCGWGCPVGQLHRMTETSGTPSHSRSRRLLQAAGAVVYAALLPLSLLAWWSDWRILFESTGGLRVGVWAGLLGATGLALAHGRWWSWGFCRTACPIGLYYSFVAPARWFGITFPRPDNCIECNLCDNVCPVNLAPRTLMEPIPSPGGLAIADAPGRNHCLECGDCVRACEWIVKQKTGAETPLELGFHGSSDKGKEPNELTNYSARAS